MPSSWLMARRESITILAFSGSSEAIGSSASRMRGRCARARAMATRCCCPPDSVSARCSAVCAMPNRSSAWIASARSSAVNTCAMARQPGISNSRPVITLVSTSSRPTRLNCWKIIAQSDRQARSSRPLRRAMSLSPNRICPSLGSSRRLSRRKRVDLPAPDRPMMPTIWPSGMSSVTLDTATVSWNRRVSWSSLSIWALRGIRVGAGMPHGKGERGAGTSARPAARI